MNINGIEVAVERKKIKNVHLSVYPPDGRVHISVPMGYSDTSIIMYVLQKWVWITEKREQLTSFDYQPERLFVSGEEHYFLGRKYRLKVNRKSVGAYNVSIDGDYIVMNVHDTTTKENLQSTLYSWYKSQLSPIVKRFVKKWEDILNIKFNHWEIRLMNARWGSCAHEKKEAMFNVELAKKPIDCIEYVVAHETVHLIERNHTDRFFRLLDTHLPGWQSLQKKLNGYPI